MAPNVFSNASYLFIWHVVVYFCVKNQLRNKKSVLWGYHYSCGLIKSNKARSRPDRNYQFPITYIYIHGHVYSGIVRLIIKSLASCIFYINVIFEQKKQYLCGKAITSHCMKTKSCAKSFAFELGTPVNYMQNYQNGKFLPQKNKIQIESQYDR